METKIKPLRILKDTGDPPFIMGDSTNKNREKSIKRIICR
jgi:hypothetical protein